MASLAVLRKLPQNKTAGRRDKEGGKERKIKGEEERRREGEKGENAG